MLDLFVIFTKGGLVLFYFQGTSQSLTGSVNALVKNVLLVERSGSTTYDHEGLALKYKLDNEFELVFVVGYQKILQLSYLDKFLTDIQQEFRDKYKDDLKAFNVSRNFDFNVDFQNMLKDAEAAARKEELAPRAMRSFEESQKSKKTVASMIENNNKSVDKKAGAKGKENKQPVQAPMIVPDVVKAGSSDVSSEEDSVARNRQNFIKKMQGTNKGAPKPASTPEMKKKATKANRCWDNSGTSRDVPALDFSASPSADGGDQENGTCAAREDELVLRGQMAGDLRGIETESDSDEDLDSSDSFAGDETPAPKGTSSKAKPAAVAAAGSAANNANGNASKPSSRGGGIFGMFKSLVGSKALTSADIRPVLEKMKDHLIGKNVAADISDKLCESVATKLEGKVLGTFNGVTSTVKKTLYESCVQILTPHRRVDILRDALESRQNGRPYCITFCGVNGVGKSTNLAKVAFWLVENGFRLLIAACDTFRAGAVEQLRTHVRKLNAIHPPADHGGRQMVQLYEKGYGKDAAGIAMEAINFARDTKIDIVLVDTAGRMQDNEPLMRALAKLIKVNQPDLVLFVGEALVGNEAVDQLVKFNQALADNSQMEKPRLIDGIVLTKFDTIDDKVGAAISMTYTTGQPIVFVGTGQTYTDLKTLNAKAVVSALLK